MKKVVENQQNSNISFKIKITKKEVPALSGTGLWGQLRSVGNRTTYVKTDFTLDQFKDALNDLYSKEIPKDRSITLRTNEAGYKMFQDAINEQLKIKNNEQWKGFDFKSKVFKQTYKFR